MYYQGKIELFDEYLPGILMVYGSSIEDDSYIEDLKKRNRMGYYQKFHKKNNKNWQNKGNNNYQKPSYRKPPYDPAKEAEKKLKEEEKILTHDQLEKYIPIFNSLDILHCVGMFNKIRKKITKSSRQILKMLIVNKLLYHNPLIPWEGEIPDEVKEVNEYIEFLKIKNLEYTGQEKQENQ